MHHQFEAQGSKDSKHGGRASMESDQNHRNRCRNEAEKAAAGTATAVAALLPDEMLQTILLKLPVKSLLRCKSVCKQWRSLISEAYFAKSQVNQINPYRRMCAVVRFPKTYVSLSFDLVFSSSSSSSSEDIKVEPSSNIRIPFGKPPVILGSCYGLFLAFLLVLECTAFEALLWNPCTGEYKYIPETRRLFDDFFMGRPNSSIINCYIAGFGYDSFVDDFKSVIIFHDKHEISYIRVFIFTCRTGTSWVELSNYGRDHGFPYLIPFSFPCVTLNNGAPYWIVQRYCIINNKGRDDDLVIVYFDWSEERLKEVPLPDDSTLITKNFFELLMVDLCGCICVVDHSKNNHIDVWVMKEHGVKDSWTKLFVFPKSIPKDYLTPLGFTKNGEVLLICSKRLIIYDCNTGKEVVLFSFGRKSFLNFSLCMESLVSPNGAEGSRTLKQCKVERETLIN